MKPDPITFTRAYLDKFDGENWDGKGIKAAVVLSAEWVRGVISGQETDIVLASLRLASDRVEDFKCWSGDEVVGEGHFFPRAMAISQHNLRNPGQRQSYGWEEEA